MPATEPVKDRSVPIREALLEKGYRLISYMDIQHQTHARAFQLYVKGNQQILVELYTNGGCEVWKPVAESSNIQETIDAIPT